MGSRARIARDEFTEELVQIVDQRIRKLQAFISDGTVPPRNELATFVWTSARLMRKCIQPEKDASREKGWTKCKGMLKDIINFSKFTPGMFHDSCVEHVLESEVVKAFERYMHFLVTGGEIKTKHPAPKELGESPKIMCVDKPCQYVCEYGGSEGLAPKLYSGATSWTMLLDGDRPQIQIHQYLALKYNFETAVGTREYWKLKEKYVTCTCGECEYCACTQTGCCNRLDRETSGVMLVAKTMQGYIDVRKQFNDKGWNNDSDLKKFYLALACGTVPVPEDEGGCALMNQPIAWDQATKKSLNYNDIEEKAAYERKWAETWYKPLVWFSGPGGRPFTLMRLQIITGRRHQIRFHCKELGFPLLGDPKYGAPKEDLEWAGRMFLHSYQTCYREPSSRDELYQATSPVPPELCAVLSRLTVDRMEEVPPEGPYLLRRPIPELGPLLRQYNPDLPLLVPVVRGKPTAAQLPSAPNARPAKAAVAPAAVEPPPPAARPAVGSKALHIFMETGGGPGPPAKRQRGEAHSAVAPSTPPEISGKARSEPEQPVGWVRKESRSNPGNYYYYHNTSGESRGDPPEPWEVKMSKTHGKPYYFNPLANVTVWVKPEI